MNVHNLDLVGPNNQDDIMERHETVQSIAYV